MIVGGIYHDEVCIIIVIFSMYVSYEYVNFVFLYAYLTDTQHLREIMETIIIRDDPEALVV